jgi:CheY-like chemotaxis protein
VPKVVRVLVVDDDAAIRSLMAVTLAAEGFTVVSAATAVEGLAVVLTAGVDVVVVDASMPNMTGWELAREIRLRQPRSPPRVLVVGGGSQRAPTTGVDRLLGKPFEPTELLAAVRKLAGWGGRTSPRSARAT